MRLRLFFSHLICEIYSNCVKENHRLLFCCRGRDIVKGVMQRNYPKFAVPQEIILRLISEKYICTYYSLSQFYLHSQPP